MILTLTQLRQQWRGAAVRAERRRSLVEGRVQRWHRYRRGLGKLQRFLADARDFLPGPVPVPGGPEGARRALRQLQVRIRPPFRQAFHDDRSQSLGSSRPGPRVSRRRRRTSNRSNVEWQHARGAISDVTS